MIPNSTPLLTGDNRKLLVRDVSELYKELARKYIPTEGFLKHGQGNKYSAVVHYNASDCQAFDLDKPYRVFDFFIHGASSPRPAIFDLSVATYFYDLHEIMSARSLNGIYTARLTRARIFENPQSPNTRQLLKITQGTDTKTIEISKLNIHGPIVTDSQIATFEWSSFGKQDKLLYICKPKPPKHISFTEPEDQASSRREYRDTPRGNQFMRQFNWGESKTDIEHTLIGILDVGYDYHISTIEVENFTLAGSRWLDGGSKIVSTAYNEQPGKLGLSSCNNRPSKIVIHDLKKRNKIIKEIVDPKFAYHSPRVNNRGDCFLYLSNPSFGAHRHAEKMNLYRLQDGSSQELVDTETGRSDYFIKQMPHRCFTKDDSHILIPMFSALHQYIGVYNLITSKLSKMSFPLIGVEVFDFRDDIILACGSDINVIPTAYLGRLDPTNMREVVRWHLVGHTEYLSEAEYKTVRVERPDRYGPCTALLVKPCLHSLHTKFPFYKRRDLITEVNKLPTVVIPHGGPHSSFSIQYMPWVVFYARLGLRTLLINYRGSLGVSAEYVTSLYGKIGEQDVEDCKVVLKYVIDNEGVREDKLALQGGSHGGFIIGHLATQGIHNFTSSILWNPVLDLPSISGCLTDSPDWILTECLGHDSYEPGWVPSKEELDQMYLKSPMFKANRCTIPTFVAVGYHDRRVDMSQGLRWIDALKARGVETLCKVYNDGHGLSKPDTSADINITGVYWILIHLTQEELR